MKEARNLLGMLEKQPRLHENGPMTTMCISESVFPPLSSNYALDSALPPEQQGRRIKKNIYLFKLLHTPRPPLCVVYQLQDWCGQLVGGSAAHERTRIWIIGGEAHLRLDHGLNTAICQVALLASNLLHMLLLHPVILMLLQFDRSLL